MNNLLKKIILKKDTKNILKTKKCAIYNQTKNKFFVVKKTLLPAMTGGEGL